MRARWVVRRRGPGCRTISAEGAGRAEARELVALPPTRAGRHPSGWSAATPPPPEPEPEPEPEPKPEPEPEPLGLRAVCCLVREAGPVTQEKQLGPVVN